MSVYLEVSILFTFAVLFFVVTLIKPSKYLRNILYSCICCLICSLVSVFIEYSWLVFILCWVLLFRFDYKRWFIAFVFYVFIIQCMTLITPCQIENGILYFPISSSKEVLVSCFGCIIMTFLYSYLYNPIIYQFRYAMIQFDEVIIKGWGYLDSGNTSFIDGKPVVFIKDTVEVKDLFTNNDVALIRSIQGECMYRYIPCLIKYSFGGYVESYAVCVEFDGRYDFILNLYS